MKYPIAANGIFNTLQGEGYLLGVPMNFIRLAGCSVGCLECDTDYRVNRRMTVEEIAAEYDALPKTEWAQITGGEPLDHSLHDLIVMLKRRGKVALATSGTKPINYDPEAVDFVSVSPHSTPDKLVLKTGNQINMVPELGGMDLRNWESFDFSGFQHRYATPLSGRWNMSECERWVKTHAGWRMGIQAHKSWGVA